MGTVHKDPLPGFVSGKKNEARRSTRRQTIAPISIIEGPEFEEGAAVVNLSVDGAFIQTSRLYPIGTSFQFKLELPTVKGRPIPVGGRIVRADDSGLGISFNDIKSKDRSKLREYALFAEMDDMVVKVQRKMDKYLQGNLLPICDRPTIEARLRQAANNKLEVLVVDPFHENEPINANIGLSEDGLQLQNLERPLPKNARAVYIIVNNGPLQFLFEGLLAEAGETPRILEPERMYHNERRSGLRQPVDNSWLEFNTPHSGDGMLRLPVVDFSERGCAIKTSRKAIIIPGMRLPEFSIRINGVPRTYKGATVRRLVPDGPEEWLVGLNFWEGGRERDAFADIKKTSTNPKFWSVLSRFSGLAKQKIKGLVGGKTEPDTQSVCVTRYKNDRGDQVTGLLDATFDPREDVTDVDVAVVVAPAFLRRKEVFSLLARTLVDNFRAQKVTGVVLRFDATHTVGESYIDPELEAKGTPYLKWTFSHLKSDIKASMAHLERRYRPKARVLVTFSVAAMAARRYIADGNRPEVDHWISPFGCPDAQDMFQNYLAGIDLFQNYLNGKSAEPFLIYGRMADPNHVFPDAMKNGMAFLEQAREDMEKIKCPVTWIVGTYDYMVTRERVRQLLNAPGGGPREVFELPSGHILKSGTEAIESFKLISESIAKQVLGRECVAGEPDMAAFVSQNEAEWERVKQDKLTNAQEFWNRHLFGTGSEREGYDVLLYNPDYVEFLDKQAGLLDPQPGEHVADIGCGTGNFSVALLRSLDLGGRPFRLTCMDLVPAGIERTTEKIRQIVRKGGSDGWGGLEIETKVVDLETARLGGMREFLTGELHGVAALSGRIEGLHPGTIHKLADSYGPEMHRILRGKHVGARNIMELCPKLDDGEVETVQELSRLSRYLQDRVLPSDLIPGRSFTGASEDLLFRHLTVSPANRDCRVNCPSEAFDRIGSSLVLSYIFDPLSVMREFLRVLKPGGVAVVSSLKQNFDSSKSYLAEAKTIAERKDIGQEERTRLLDSLREFASFVGCVMELEDEGRFRFFTAEELASLAREAGFINIEVFESFGEPATAVIVRAQKPDG